jgi:hypothetical protein
MALKEGAEPIADAVFKLAVSLSGLVGGALERRFNHPVRLPAKLGH